MGHGILPFQFEPAPRPMDLTAHAGLPLVSETLLALGLDDLVREQLRVRVRRRGYTEFDKRQTIVLIQAAGGECVEDVRGLAREGGLTRLLHRPLPSPDALHDFLGTCHDEPQMAQRPGAGAWIPPEHAALQALGSLNTALIQRAVAGVPAPAATLDLDATTIGSHKRDALPLYTGGRGYQPTAVCWVEQDLVVADQVPRWERARRDGPAHGGAPWVRRPPPYRVTKNDRAAGVPPSGKFGASAAWYRLTLLTYNVLTVLRHRVLPPRFWDARPKRLRSEVFTGPAAIRAHARQLTARLGAPPLTVEEVVTARKHLRDLRATLRAGRASRYG